MSAPATNDYHQLVADLPRPTTGQRHSFIEFVARAHSWYKHLPSLPPGAAFHFYLNPNAGRSQICTPTGETAFVDRVAGDGSEFHYTWMPTAEYRQRFGFLDYHCGRGTALFVFMPGGQTEVLAPGLQVLGPTGDWLRPSEELLQAGTCRVTCFVHPHHNVLLIKFEDDDEAFGQLTAAEPDNEDLMRYQPLRDCLADYETDRSHDEISRFYNAFHELERPRLLALMRAALDRFLAALE